MILFACTDYTDRALRLNGLYEQTANGKYVLFFDPNHGGSARYVVRHNNDYLILGYYQADELDNVRSFAGVAKPWHATFTNKRMLPRVEVTFYKYTHTGSQSAIVQELADGALRFKWDDGNEWKSIPRTPLSDNMFQKTKQLYDSNLVSDCSMRCSRHVSPQASCWRHVHAARLGALQRLESSSVHARARDARQARHV